MKYVILIHSNPDPWGHPTSHYTPEGKAMPTEWHERTDREFEALLSEMSASGELVSAEALADPSSSTVYAWTPEGHLATDGPYAEVKEQLAGFFLIDCRTRQRAEEIAAQFAQPGGTIELRPAMWPGAEDQ
ncbi:YciI family protein [Actinopolymorpha sp. B11F2]|uniref:YciI family protein n=1 Tax=Actinopolymorpha sp. B11F2 TaxID=3160862 RepID=UPI0032E46944